jgi:hypothetical protein
VGPGKARVAPNRNAEDTAFAYARSIVDSCSIASDDQAQRPDEQT